MQHHPSVTTRIRFYFFHPLTLLPSSNLTHPPDSDDLLVTAPPTKNQKTVPLSSSLRPFWNPPPPAEHPTEHAPRAPPPLTTHMQGHPAASNNNPYICTYGVYIYIDILLYLCMSVYTYLCCAILYYSTSVHRRGARCFAILRSCAALVSECRLLLPGSSPPLPSPN